MKIKRYILTGTPGSGKTSVINVLEELGHIVVHEATTDLIIKEQESGITQPWEWPNFTDKIILLQQERQVNTKGNPQFYDRSPFCTYALAQYISYSNKNNFIPSPTLLEIIDQVLKDKTYQNKVFFFENLGFIKNTDVRKISYEEALIFEKMHVDIYIKFGFNIEFVPKQSIKNRCEFILSRIIEGS